MDVATDLPVLLEQLPDAIQRARRNEEFELDLYEQGVERRLIFSPVDGDYAVACESMSGWIPSVGAERVDKRVLLQMLTSVRDGFVEATRTSLPNLAVDPWFRRWANLR